MSSCKEQFYVDIVHAYREVKNTKHALQGCHTNVSSFHILRQLQSLKVLDWRIQALYVPGRAIKWQCHSMVTRFANHGKRGT